MSFILVITVSASAAANAAADTEPTRTEPIRVVTTTAMIAEPLGRIVGDTALITTLIGTGVDPHSYRPTRSDIVALASADAIIWTSDHLEPRFARPIKRLKRHIPTLYLIEHFKPEQLIVSGGATDPHLWMDALMWSEALGYATEFLANLDTQNAAAYRRRLAAYQIELDDLSNRISDLLAAIPEPQRVLITSHDAFSYFGRRHRLQVKSLLGISTESEVSLATVEDLVDFIAERRIAAVFSESSLPIDYLAALQQGLAARGMDLAVGGPLFADSLDAPHKPAGTYAGMLLTDACAITTALTDEGATPQC